MKESAYWQCNLSELRDHCKRRKITVKGNKADLIKRLVAWDEKQANSAKLPPAEDRTVFTQGGKFFNICGGCQQWDKRCRCVNGEDSEEPGTSGTGNPSPESQEATVPRQNKQAKRRSYRGTFA